MKSKLRRFLLASAMIICTVVFLLATKSFLDGIECSSFQAKTNRRLNSEVLVDDVVSADVKGLLSAALRNEAQKRRDSEAKQSMRDRVLGVRSTPRANLQNNDLRQQQENKQDISRNSNAVISAAKLKTFVRRPAEFRSPLAPNMSLQEIVKNAQILCELLLYEMGNCREGEHAEACILRIGARNLEAVLPIRCRESSYFQHFVKKKEAAALDPEAWPKLHRTHVYEEQVFWTRIPRPQYVPPANRPQHMYRSGPRVCNSAWSKIKGCQMHPIGFAVPEAAIAKTASRVKLFDFVPFLPRWYPMPAGFGYSLGIHEEEFSRLLYRHSFFGFTHRRGGFDVLRHYETITQGALPYFPDLLQCDKFCMPAFPKDLAARALNLVGVRHMGLVKEAADGVSTRYMIKEPGVEFNNPKLPHVLNFRTQGDIHWGHFNTTAYFQLADEILAYARRHLTTKALATYMLEAIGHEEPRNVLVVLGPSFSYFTESIMHGLYDLGINYTTTTAAGAGSGLDAAATQRIETESPLQEAELEDKREAFRSIKGQLYGFGLRRTDPNPSIALDAAKAHVVHRDYDLVLYMTTVHPDRDSKGEFLADRPLWAEVSQAYSAGEIAFVDATDDVNFDPTPVTAEMCGKGVIFRRSLHDKEC